MKCHNLIKEVFLFLFIINETLGSFVPTTNNNGKYQTIHQYKNGEMNNNMILPQSQNLKSNSSTQLAMDFGGFGKFFNLNNNSNNDNNNNNDGRKDTNNQDDDDENDDEEEGYLGCTNIFKIKLKALKLGGTRLYLSLFFMGESNNPTKGSWRMNQNGDGGIDLYYKDTSGALIVVFNEDNNSIEVNRLGSSPSMDYLTQESTMLNGMLDQLDEIASDGSIDEKDRLIRVEDDAINNVRETLSFT